MSTKAIFDTCCGLCGHEIRDWECRTILPNTYNSETESVHADCAIARYKRTEEYFNTVVCKPWPESLTTGGILK